LVQPRKPDFKYQEGPVETDPAAIPEIRYCFRRLDRAAYRPEFAILQDLIANVVLQKKDHQMANADIKY